MTVTKHPVKKGIVKPAMLVRVKVMRTLEKCQQCINIQIYIMNVFIRAMVRIFN
jgi:hypothetical protein